jgi:arsenite oxidase small subunit
MARPMNPVRQGTLCMNRRQLLVLGGTSVAVLAVLRADDLLAAQGAKLVGSRYPAKRIGRLAELEAKKPVEFTYPNKDVTNVLVKLGERAGAGIGPDQDVVAFNTVCPHMGGPVGADTYKATHNVLGPCPLHLTTFDLTRHGIVVSGHATESLPQIVLELRKDEIWAVGVMGLVYGFAANPSG